MQRILCVFLAIMMILTICVPAIAANESPITPRYTYISINYAGLSIHNLTGLASCHANCFVTGGDSVILACVLQRYNGSHWVAVKSWSVMGDQSALLNKNYAVASGYTYRVRVTCSVYDSTGTLLESGTCYSNQVVY